MELVRDMAGTWTLLLGKDVAIHIWLKKTHKTRWGYSEFWVDGWVQEFGLGRLLLICKGPFI